MLDIIKLRIEAGDSSLLETFRDIEKNFGIMVDNAKEGEKAFKKMTDRYEADLKRINTQLEKAKNQTKGGSIIGDIITANVAQQAIGYIGQIAKAGFDIATNFEKVKVTFENAFGDKDLAKSYLDTIQQFAAKTPFEFDKLAESILKLKNRGFQPTVEELTKLGDLAATTGKEFDQLAEAVLDAQTGEFERLKEFGIRASKANGQVTLSFKGVTQTVQDNDKAIRDAIISYGTLNGVAGAMAVQSQTVAGKISNLKDSLGQLAVTIGSSTEGNTKRFIGNLTDIVTGINDTLDPLKALTRGYDEQRLKVIALDEKLPALQKRYEELTNKGVNITKKEQEELNDVIRQIGIIVPDAVTRVDQYGNALEINRQKIEGFKFSSKAELKELGEATIKLLDEKIVQQQGVFNRLEKLAGKKEVTFFGDVGERTKTEAVPIKDALEKVNSLKQVEIARNELRALQAQKKDLEDQVSDKNKNLTNQEIAAIEDYNKAQKTSYALSYDNYQKILALKAKEEEANKKGGASAKAVADAEKEASDRRKKALEDLAKAYESFNDKLEKAKVDSLTGVERIEAERKVAQAELLEKLNLAKKDAEQVKNARGATVAEKKKAAEEIAQITAAAKELESLINKKYDDQILKFAQEEQKKILELNKKTLDEKIKNIEEEGKLKELELSIAEQGNAVYTKEEQVAIKRIELEQRTLEAKRKAFLDAKGISTNSDTNIATLDTTSLNKVDLAELKRQNADIEKIKQDGRNQQFANDLAALNRKEEILTAEVGLIEKSGEGVLSLEEFKEKQILIIKQKALQDEIEIARLRYGPKSTQVQLLDVQLKLLTRKIANFNDQKVGKGIEGFLKKQLNISDEDFNLILSKAQELVSAVGSLISQQNELELQQLEERQSILDDKIKQTEDNIKKEQDLKDKGFRNNLEAEQATLAALTAEKQKAAEEEKKLRKDQLTQQLIADEISAASSLALAISQIILQSSKYGPILGLVTAGIGILGMIALFTKYKAATKKLEDGGSLQDSGFVSLRGRTDKFGGRGHRIEDSNIVVGGSEFITNEVDSQRYVDVLKRVNAGKLRRKPKHEIASFVKWMDGDALPRVSLPGIPEHQSVYIQNVMANPANKEIFAGSSQENRLLEVVKGMSVEIRSMREELSDLKKITAKRPIHTPIPGGYMETVGNNTTIIKFKQKGND